MKLMPKDGAAADASFLLDAGSPSAADTYPEPLEFSGGISVGAPHLDRGGYCDSADILSTAMAAISSIHTVLVVLKMLWTPSDPKPHAN